MRVLVIAGSSNGRTAVSGTVYLGSSPSPAANKLCHNLIMQFWIKRLSHPFRGLRYAFSKDFAVRFETVVFGIIGIPTVYFLFGPLSALELLLLIFCWFFIVVTEIQNTSIEIALTKLHPGNDEEIGRSKDLASGAVVLAFMFGLVSLVFIVFGWI